MQKLTHFLSIVFSKFFPPEDVFYIGGPDTLPPPLTRHREQELASRLPDDTAARCELIEHNLRLVVYIAKRFESSPSSLEDLVSIGTIGLIKAVNTFDGSKNIKLATYASRCIENEILMYLRRSSKLKAEVSFDDPLNTDWDGNELLLSDVLGTDPDIVSTNIETQTEKELLMHAISGLNSREQRIICLRYGLIGEKERTQKEIADMLGISQSYISRLEKRIMKRLKKQISSVM
ncbi:MAG: RNA polymerase sporulation sigma factor SigE [Clostridiales bacterium]|nr:RNA polymerase sporulation sigma factor SigE [Clostridiales bacterium]